MKIKICTFFGRNLNQNISNKGKYPFPHEKRQTVNYTTWSICLYLKPLLQAINFSRSYCIHWPFIPRFIRFSFLGREFGDFLISRHPVTNGDSPSSVMPQASLEDLHKLNIHNNCILSCKFKQIQLNKWSKLSEHSMITMVTISCIIKSLKLP